MWCPISVTTYRTLGSIGLPICPIGLQVSILTFSAQLCYLLTLSERKHRVGVGCGAREQAYLGQGGVCTEASCVEVGSWVGGRGPCSRVGLRTNSAIQSSRGPWRHREGSQAGTGLSIRRARRHSDWTPGPGVSPANLSIPAPLSPAPVPASSAPCSVFIPGSQLQRVGETGPVTAVSGVLLLVLRYKSRFHARVPRGS